MDPALKIL